MLLANTRLAVRRRVEAARDPHGQARPAGWGEVNGPHPGRTKENADGTWSLGLDTALWPVRVGDLVIAADGGSWLVTSAALLRNHADPAADWVRCAGQHRTDGHTEPGGAWFVARYDDYVEPSPPTPPPPPSRDAAGLWTGYGPPPEPSAAFWPQVGDEYLDLYTGTIYRLGVG